MRKHLLFAVVLLSLSAGAQNVGIGTATPNARLHVNSGLSEVLRVEAINPYVSFFDGGVYRGYLWSTGSRMELGSSTPQPVVIRAYYQDVAHFTPDKRVGINTPSPTETLDVAGNINLRGVLKIDGSAGANGQVYVTGGPGLNPQWKSMAHSNNIRFSASFEKNAGSSSGDARFTTTRYNLNTTDVVINTAGITINRSGLYHFELQVNAGANFPTSQTAYPHFTCSIYTGIPQPYDMVDGRSMFPTTADNAFFYLDDKSSLEVYIEAPALIRVRHGFGLLGSSTSQTVSGYLNGHLISE